MPKNLKCSICGYEFDDWEYESMYMNETNDVTQQESLVCNKCWDKLEDDYIKNKIPFFIQHIPNFSSGFNTWFLPIHSIGDVERIISFFTDSYEDEPNIKYELDLDYDDIIYLVRFYPEDNTYSVLGFIRNVLDADDMIKMLEEFEITKSERFK